MHTRSVFKFVSRALARFLDTCVWIVKYATEILRGFLLEDHLPALLTGEICTRGCQGQLWARALWTTGTEGLGT